MLTIYSPVSEHKIALMANDIHMRLFVLIASTSHLGCQLRVLPCQSYRISCTSLPSGGCT